MMDGLSKSGTNANHEVTWIFCWSHDYAQNAGYAANDFRYDSVMSVVR